MSRFQQRAARHRDAGLRRITWATRAFAAASVATLGALTALAAHAQVGKAAAHPRVATVPTPLSTPKTGTLPPDTFPPSNDLTPPTAATAQPQPPVNVPQPAPLQDPQVVSGAS